jgi:predicted PurR-regulated permease PerM
MNKKADPSTSFEQLAFALFLGLITIGLIVILWPFAAPILWSVLAAIMFQPLYLRLLRIWPNHANRSALLTLLIIFIAIIVPAFAIGNVVFQQISSLYLALQSGRIDVASLFMQVHDALPVKQQSMLDNLGLSDPNIIRSRAEQLVTQSAGFLARQAVAIGGSAFGYLLALGVSLYVTYFLLRDGQRLGPAIRDALPFEQAVADRLGAKFIIIVRATIKGSFVVGLTQGALGGITFWVAGVPSAPLFGALMVLLALLPALGPAIVWVPVAIYLLAIGDVWQAVTVAVSGVAVIGMADNILRPILVGRDTGIPDWLVLLTTLGGIATLGLSGIVLGPLAAGLFLAAWAIYNEQQPE